MIVEEREDHLLEVGYAIYNGFVGAYITNKEESISRLIDERWHVPACRRGFKNYLRHKVLKTKDDFNFGMIPQQSRKDWMFDCDFRIVSFY